MLQVFALCNGGYSRGGRLPVQGYGAEASIDTVYLLVGGMPLRLEVLSGFLKLIVIGMPSGLDIRSEVSCVLRHV